jgi:pimeloyl-ACP methyl ester carboxylesterase
VTRVGLPYVGRLAVYQKGEANILFVLEALRKLKLNADYAHLTLVGHSNGGDTAMYFAMQHPEQVSRKWSRSTICVCPSCCATS